MARGVTEKILAYYSSGGADMRGVHVCEQAKVMTPGALSAVRNNEQLGTSLKI